DLCPNTPIGAEVDEHGCSVEQLDADGDGVPNDRDDCPNTPPGTPVGPRGCPIVPPDPCAPSIQWQAGFGSDDNDSLDVVHQLPDGGYVVAGEYSRIPWVVRLDSNGVEVWNRLYQETGSDHLSDLQ